MAAYYAGLALGGLRGKQLIFRIRQIRAFAVFSALTAVTALAYAVFFNPAAWLLLRIVNGFCITGLTAAIESWLNTRSSTAHEDSSNGRECRTPGTVARHSLRGRTMLAPHA